MIESEIFKDFHNHDRNAYPAPVVRVTGGMGGEALLIIGPEKTALYDAGMACFSERLISNLKRELTAAGTQDCPRTLDYVVLSHTHYDHMGGLPYVLQHWPQACVCASEKADRVFRSEGARRLILELGKNAVKNYRLDGIDIIVNPLRVDWIVKDGDRVDLGTCPETGEMVCLEVLETRGHTDCALTWLLKPQGILFTCESTGVLVSPEHNDVSALKDFEETIRVARRLKELEFSWLISPHYGVVPQWFNEKYFDLYIEMAERERDFIEGLVREGKSFDEILEAHKEVYWLHGRADAQPFAAYRLNTESEVKQIMMKVAQEG